MFDPEPGWVALPHGTGASTAGIWRTETGGHPVVVKRLSAPTRHDPPELSDPRHAAYWRRPAEVVLSGVVAASPGLRAPVTSVEVDTDGITVTEEWVEDAALSGLFAAHALGRFAATDLGEHDWLARSQLRARLTSVERAGGWRTLARTTVADVADHLWSRRAAWLDALDALPQVAMHGDATTHNLRGRHEVDLDLVVAIDWGGLGTGPVGADLGYLSLSAREAFEPLAESYLLGLPGGVATEDQVLTGARVTAAYTALSRAEWALARVAGGEGALAGKYRHPAVAPHLRTLQRQFPQIEALVG